MSSKRWTTDERMRIWLIYLGWNHTRPSYLSDAMLAAMAQAVGKSLASVSSELWKIFRSKPGGPAYWQQSGRLEVKWQRKNPPGDFSPVEDYVITISTKSGLPITRIAELLGRSATQCLRRLHKLQGRDRPNLGLIKENRNACADTQKE